eukprot:Colp12_sorted_trinity150504_noHs@4198
MALSSFVSSLPVGQGLASAAFVLWQAAAIFTIKYIRKKASSKEDKEIVVTSPGSASLKPALVVVLGWGGAKRRHLRRLIENYQQLNITTISCVPPVEHVTIDRRFPISEIEELVSAVNQQCEVLKSKTGKTPALFWHVHSNNGVLAFGAIDTYLKQKKGAVLQAPHGIMIDSAPMLTKRMNIFTALTGWLIGSSFPLTSIVLNKPQYVHPFWTPMIIFSNFNNALLSLVVPPSEPAVDVRDIFKTLNEDFPRVPQLYLYSTQDKIIHHKYVENFLNTQKERGSVVETKRWDDSIHVSHYRTHPEEYMQLVTDFMSRHSTK